MRSCCRNLASFKYLRGRSILTLMVVLMLSSMLSSMTALSLLSLHKGLSLCVGEGEDIVVIYDVRSRTPFTGLVPAFLTDRIAALSGVLACSPEVIVPCIVGGESIFLRGVLPEEFLKISNITIIDGEILNPNDLNFAIVGRRASEKIGLKVGERVLVIGVLSPVYLELRVKGVFRSDGALEDEIIAPLHVGQWLRGAGYNHVTIIRVKASNGVNILEALSNLTAESPLKPSQPSGEGQSSLGPPIAHWAVTYFRVEDVGVKGAENFMKDYIERYGITRESIIILSAATLFFSGAAILLAARTLVSQHSGELEVLRSIGASRRLLRRDLILKLAPATLLASALGIILAVAILDFASENGLLQVLFHSIGLQVDILVITLTMSIVFMLVVIGIWRTVR